MRILTTVLASWAAVSMGVAFALGYVLKRLHTVPPLPDIPVDDWSPVRVDAEFYALARDYAEREAQR